MENFLKKVKRAGLFNRDLRVRLFTPTDNCKKNNPTSKLHFAVGYM